MFNTFSMMLLKFKCITVLAFLILECYVLSLCSGLLNIERGYRDVFDKPNCDSHTKPGCNCKGLYAECVEGTNCTRCRCSDTYATFLSSDGKNGECVKNRHLLFISASSNSFSVENIESNQCIIQKWNNTLRTHFITKTTCQSDEKIFPYQRWIWTRYNQLMHVKALRCLQPCRSKCSKMVSSGKYYWRLQLGTCNSTKTNQLWQCTKENSFRLETSELYMYLDSSEDYIYASNSSKGINWKRFSTNKKLCSRAFGCYDFVHSVILVTDINCDQTEKEIAVPPKDGENSCSVMWEKLQYLDNKIWKDLNFRDKIFTIVRRSKRTFLQLNFLKATNNWTGLIVKLQFSCAVNAAESKCIVVKFRENPTVCPTTIPSTVKPTKTTMQVSTSIVTDVKLITNSPTTFTTDTTPNRTSGIPENRKSDSSHAAIIAVCVVVAVLIFLGILGFIFYRRRRRLAGNKEGDSHGPTEPYENTTNPIYSLTHEKPTSLSSGEKKTHKKPRVDASMNPIYSPGDGNPTPVFSSGEATYSEPQTGASQECLLYEPGDVHIYNYADVERNVKRPPQEHSYDYARSDDVRPVAQRLAIRNQSHDDVRDARSGEKVLNGNEEQGSGQNPVYQTLEDTSMDM